MLQRWLNRSLADTTNAEHIRRARAHEARSAVWREVFHDTRFVFSIASAIVGAVGIAAAAYVVTHKEPVRTEVLYVDRVSGVIGPLTVLRDGKMDYGDAMRARHVAEFITCYEGYNPGPPDKEGNFPQLEEERKKCFLFAPPHHRDFMKKHFDEQTAAYEKEKMVVRIEFRSFTMDENKSMFVRFSRIGTNVHTKATSEANYAARIVSSYDAGIVMDEKNRRLNPLGFFVTVYKPSEETINSVAKEAKEESK